MGKRYKQRFFGRTEKGEGERRWKASLFLSLKIFLHHPLFPSLCALGNKNVAGFFTFVAQSQFIKRKCSHSFPLPHPILLWRSPPPIPSHLPLMYSHPLRGKGKKQNYSREKGRGTPPTFPNSSAGGERKVFKSEQHILTSSSSVYKGERRVRAFFPPSFAQISLLPNFSLSLSWSARAPPPLFSHIEKIFKKNIFPVKWLVDFFVGNNLSVVVRWGDMGLAKYPKECLCFSLPSFLPLSIFLYRACRWVYGEKGALAAAAVFHTHTHSPFPSFLIHASLPPPFFPAAFSERNEGRKRERKRRVVHIIMREMLFLTCGKNGGGERYKFPVEVVTCAWFIDFFIFRGRM